MALTTTIVGSGRYQAVAGLTWRPLGADPRTEIKTACQTNGTKHGLLFEPTDGRQILGLLPLTSPAKARSLPSGAAWLAAASARPVILIKQLPGGMFWVVAAGAGQLQYRTDQILNETEAAEFISNLLSDVMELQGDSRPRVIIDGERYPQAHMLERFSEKEFQRFDDLVRGYVPKKPEMVKQLIGIKPAQILSVLAFVALIGLAYGGMKFWQKLQADAEFEAQRLELERQRLVTDELHTKAELRIAQAVIAAMSEDTATPDPDSVIGACTKAYQRTGTEIGGWRVTRLTCNPNGSGLAIDLVRDPPTVGGIGTNATLIDTLAKRGLKPSIDVANGGRAQVTIPLIAPPIRDGLKPIEAPAFDSVQARFVERIQVLQQSLNQFSYSMTNLEPRAVMYQDPAHENATDSTRFSPVPPERVYLKGTFDLVGRSLWELGSFSLNYRFVTLTKLEFTTTGNDAESIDWKLQGLYVAARR